MNNSWHPYPQTTPTKAFTDYLVLTRNRHYSAFRGNAKYIYEVDTYMTDGFFQTEPLFWAELPTLPEEK